MKDYATLTNIDDSQRSKSKQLPVVFTTIFPAKCFRDYIRLIETHLLE